MRSRWWGRLWICWGSRNRRGTLNFNEQLSSPHVTFTTRQGGVSVGFTTKGALAATAGGALGAIGAVCIIYAFRAGGLPTYVMPLVFAGAPLVNVLFSMVLHPPKQAPNPLLYVGFVLAAAGAGMVLYFKPQS